MRGKPHVEHGRVTKQDESVLLCKTAKFSPGLRILELSFGEVTIIMAFVIAAEFVSCVCK